MNTKLSKFLIVLQAAATLCFIGAVKLWAPTCRGMLELANGNETPMKCHYAGQAAFGVAVIILFTATAALLTKKDHKMLMAANAVSAVILLLLFGSLIGICANPDMQCHSTALWGRLAAGIVFIASAADLLTGKEGQIPA